MSTPTRRSSARLAGKGSSASPTSSANSTPRKQKQPSNTTSPIQEKGKKRKADETEAIDEEQNEANENGEKRQKTLEEAVGNGSNDKEEKKTNGEAKHDEEKSKPDAAERNHEEKADTKANGAVKESAKRAEAMPSNVLEKGIIYFFARGRVNVDDPKSVKDLARTYMVLRPLPDGATLAPGRPIDDAGNNRLMALPKKVFPQSGRDTFMAFVEKSEASVEQLKEEFLQGSSYETQTVGVRTSPPVTPVGEGVYAVTTTGKESHIAYMLTIPKEPGEVQIQMGIKDKGSFIISTKSPEHDAPANANLPEPPQYPKEIVEEFRGRRWMPTLPKHLDYKNAQILLIGEGVGQLDKAVQPNEDDENDPEKDTPWEEMQRLEDEDLKRVAALSGDDSVFSDLGISKKEYPEVMTTW